MKPVFLIYIEPIQRWAWNNDQTQQINGFIFISWAGENDPRQVILLYSVACLLSQWENTERAVSRSLKNSGCGKMKGQFKAADRPTQIINDIATVASLWR